MKHIAWIVAVVLGLAGCAGTSPRGSAAPGGTAASGTTAPATAAVTAEPTPAASQTVKLPDQFSGGQTMINVYIVEEKKIQQMQVEDYLLGVLAGEMDPDWPVEALKAQAVLARTYLLYYLLEKTSSYEGADISTDVAESQAYSAQGVNDKVREAVKSTAGQVLVYEGSPIIAWFHACSGGKTALATEGLNYPQADPPYIQVVETDESSAPASAREWTASFTADEVRSAIEATGVTAPDNLEPVKIAQRGESGRCMTLTFGDTEVNCVELRKNLDPTVFRSTLLTGITWKDEKLVVSGRGYGHGVGMSQWGAKIMADGGSGYEEIINYYFKDVSLVKAWD